MHRSEAHPTHTTMIPNEALALRPTQVDDLHTLWTFQRDPESNRMAAFGSLDPDDREGYITKWTRLLADPTIMSRTILVDGAVRGSVATWMLHDERQVTYGIERAFWGRGLATSALQLFLTEQHERPLHGRCAFDNIASKRVMEKCGFTANGTDRGFARARQAEIEELLFVLR